MSFGKRLEQTRKNFAMTQTDLAIKSKLTPAAICTYESGKRLPILKNILALQNALEGISLDWLLNGVNNTNCIKCCSVKHKLKEIIKLV